MANMANKKNPNPKKAGTPKRAKPEVTDNNHQKTVGGKNQHGPADKVGKTGNQATRDHGSPGGSAGNARNERDE
jgi:hypothetical protein